MNTLRRSYPAYAIAACLSCLAGCYPYAVHHTAEPVKKGNYAVQLAPMAIISSGGASELYDDDETQVLPYFDLMGRFGVTDSSDFGVRLSPLSAGLDYNHAIYDTPELLISLSPRANLWRDVFGLLEDENDALQEELTLATATLDVLFDVVRTPGLTLTLGAKPGLSYARVKTTINDGTGDVLRDDSATEFTPGAMAAAKFRFGGSFYIMPTVDVTFSPLVDGSPYIVAPAVALGWE